MRINRKSFAPDEDKFFLAAIGVWLMCVLAGLAFWAGVIYVAIHFITKFW